MYKYKSVVALAMLLLIVSIGTACTAKQVGEPALAEVTVFEPVTPTPTAEPTPVTADGSLSTGEYDDTKDSVSSPEEDQTSPIVTKSSEVRNAPSPSTPALMPTATPMPTSTPTPLPTATAKPMPTPMPASTPTIPPVPTSTPAFTPVPTLTPVPTATPAPVLTPAPVPEAHIARTICNICGADITGNVPPHGDSHLLNGEDFSYRVE